MVDALQFFEENGEVCPADWHKGDKAMKETRKAWQIISQNDKLLRI